MTYFPKIVSSRISEDYGYAISGATNTNEKYDNVANTWSYIVNMANIQSRASGFSLNGYGYVAGGSAVSTLVEQYNNILNTWSTKQNLPDINRNRGSGTSLNGYGYHLGGFSAYVGNLKYDSILNTWTAKTNLNNQHSKAAATTINGYAYIFGGVNSGDIVQNTTDKYDDVANTNTTKRTLNTARAHIGGFSVNSYGYSIGGATDSGGTTTSIVVEKYDDINNTWTAKASLGTGTSFLDNSGFNINIYGYISGGFTTVTIATTSMYDDVLNTWTAKTNLNVARYNTTCFSLGSLKSSTQNPDLVPIIKSLIKEMIPVDQTASRAIDGTVYTNTASSNLFVTVTARCIIDTVADVANIQAFSDTAANPITASSGIVGIEGGLLGEDISVQLSFIVRPYEKYKVVSTLSAGCSATLGKWFETIMK